MPSEIEVPIVAGPEIVKRVRVGPDEVADLLGVAQDLVDETVESGSQCDDPTRTCTCFVCRALRILVAVEGPGRCVICGCTEDHACEPIPCSWMDPTRRICNRHPIEDVTTALLVLAQEATHA